MIGPIWIMDSSFDRLGQDRLFDGTTRLYGMEASSSKENQDTVIKKEGRGASLVAQWLRVCLPMRRGHGFEPWSGKIPHAAERLGP